VTEAFSPLASLRKALTTAPDMVEAMRHVAEILGEAFGFDHVNLIAEAPGPGVSQSVAGLSFRGESVWVKSRSLELPLFVSDPGRQRIEPALRAQLEGAGVKSYLLVPVYVSGQIVAALEASTQHHYLRLRGEERAYTELAATLIGMRLAERHHRQPVGDFASGPATTPVSPSTGASGIPQQESIRLGSIPLASVRHEPPHEESGGAEVDAQRRLLYGRIAEYGELLIVRTDAALRVTELVGDTQRLFGLPADALLASPMRWRRSFRLSDLRRVVQRARAIPPGAFSEEVQVVNQSTGARRWMLMRAIPVFDETARTRGTDGEVPPAVPTLVGWEGFWVDTTARRSAEERSRSQGRRIEALYEVARSLELNLDPSVVALKGLRALIRATASDCGFSGLIDGNSGQLEVVAAEGLSSQYIEDVGAILGRHTLARDAVERREGLLLSDIQKEPRAAVELARREGVRATIIMPLVFEEQVLGVMVLFRRDETQYSTDDYDLVSAACAQIALAARQAELYAAEKRHSSSLSALYRLSHELSKQMTLKEVAEHAFPSIQEEIACKRMWLGVMDNRGSHLVGTAGVGPGIRRHVIDMQVELSSQNEPLQKAIRSRIPVVFDVATETNCGEFGKVLARLNCGTIVLVPLVALGQVVGVLVVEPAVPSNFFVQRKLPLLNSMATEIATVILARKFEARMADADKMRMAGLLASGVAHNFNNLLQAVMGQASLIEMQMAHDKRITQSARMIADAAGKGAGLVKQLFNLSMQGGFAPSTIAVKGFLGDSKELYRSILGSQIQLEYDIADELPAIVADEGQLQQVLTNLLVNSKEALEGRTDGVVKVDVRRVRIRSGEVDPELAPGEYVRIEVEDNGAGMTPESLGRCFEPFFTTKNIDTRTGLGFGASGLGLSSVYSIVRQHEGAITVRSQLDHGTTFSVYLPAKSETQAQRSQPTDSPTVQAPPSTHVFMFEIDSAIAYSLRATIEGPQVRVAMPLTRERLVQLLGQVKDARALVMMDLDRVGAGARDLVQAIFRTHPAVRVCGYVADMGAWEERVGQTEHCQILEKPLRIWSMSEQVRRLLEEEEAGPAGPEEQSPSLAKRTPIAERLEVTRGNEPQLPRYPEDLKDPKAVRPSEHLAQEDATSAQSSGPGVAPGKSNHAERPVPRLIRGADTPPEGQ
jgi:signal transduction histidine kinase